MLLCLADYHYFVHQKRNISINQCSYSFYNTICHLISINRIFPRGNFPEGQFPSRKFPVGSFPEGSFPDGQFSRRSVSQKDSFPDDSFPEISFLPENTQYFNLCIVSIIVSIYLSIYIYIYLPIYLSRQPLVYLHCFYKQTLTLFVILRFLCLSD